MKYGIGDKVVSKSDLPLLFNPFYKQETRKTIVQVVTEADEDHFTIYEGDNVLQEAFSCGANHYMAYSQVSGCCWTGRDVLLHLEKDREKIKEILESKAVSERDEKLSRLSKRLRRTEQEIEDVKAEYNKDINENYRLLGI